MVTSGREIFPNFRESSEQHGRTRLRLTPHEPIPPMKEKLPSWKLVSALILAGASMFFVKTAHAAPSNVRALALPTGSSRLGSGEAVVHGTLVAPNGVTAISSIDRKWDAPSGTGTLNEADVTPNGQIASREANLVLHADGTLVARGTMTDFDGACVNYTETLQRTPNGYVARGTTSGLAGETTTYETTVVFVGRNQLRRTTVTTKSDGTTSTRVETLKTAQA